MNILRYFGTPIVVAGLMAGVVQAQQKQGKTPNVQTKTTSNQASQPYLLGPGDVLEVIVYETTFELRRIPVDSDGNVSPSDTVIKLNRYVG